MSAGTRIIALVALALVLLVPAAAYGGTTTTTISSGNLSLPIANSTWITPGSVYSPGFTESTLQVPELGTITDVDLRVRASHTYVGDLGVFLEAPDGTSVFVASLEGSGDNLGSGPTNCTGTPTVLDDEAAAPIATAAAPFAGSFKPYEPLSALDGKAADGAWVLSFIDIFPPGDAGTLHCWELVITYEQPAVDLSLRGSDRPDPVKPGKQVRYSFRAANGGPGEATNVVVTSRIPAGTTFVSARSGQGSCSRSGRTVTCHVGDLATGASTAVTVVVKAPNAPRTVTATARVKADQPDSDTADNRAQVKTKVKA